MPVAWLFRPCCTKPRRCAFFFAMIGNLCPRTSWDLKSAGRGRLRSARGSTIFDQKSASDADSSADGKHRPEIDQTGATPAKAMTTADATTANADVHP